MYHYTDGLQTERLITRFLTEEDSAIWIPYLENEETSRFMSAFLPGSDNHERAKEWMAFALKRYHENRYGLQALIHRETGEFIGQCGLLLQEVNGREEIEIGYHLLREHWSKGYATEAARAFKDYGFNNGVADSIVSIIDPQNFLSKKVAMRNGMKLDAANVEWRSGLYDVFRIAREEWEAS